MDRRSFIKTSSIALFSLALNPLSSFASTPKKSLEDSLFSIYWNLVKRFALIDEKVVIVDGHNEQLYLIDGVDGFRICDSYSVSTGINGFGSTPGSRKTPTGVHVIKEKIGYGAPLGTIFEGRYDTGKIAKINYSQIPSKKSLVTSRIMRLAGCDRNNQTSFNRYIYIHGTSDEGLIGKPVSKGCVRMKNRDVIDLFDLVNEGTYVDIERRLV